MFAKLKFCVVGLPVFLISFIDRPTDKRVCHSYSLVDNPMWGGVMGRRGGWMHVDEIDDLEGSRTTSVLISALFHN
jgi:hypothetical protein